MSYKKWLGKNHASSLSHYHGIHESVVVGSSIIGFPLVITDSKTSHARQGCKKYSKMVRSLQGRSVSIWKIWEINLLKNSTILMFRSQNSNLHALVSKRKRKNNIIEFLLSCFICYDSGMNQNF